jgi:predicted Zn-dependent peptidase
MQCRECDASSVLFQAVEFHSEYPFVRASSEGRDDFGAELPYFGEDRLQEGKQKHEIGMRFGAHVNAHTGFDETVYELQIPTDNPSVVDRSLLILEDFARAVTFEPTEIDQERGVILEEWRLGLGADERINDLQFPLLLKGSRYADRLPIGKPEIIRNVNHDRLKQLYTDWYRPDLMAVIVVGDFNKANMEFQIRSHFGSIPAATSPRPRPTFTVPAQTGTTFSVLTDPEATNTRISATSTMTAPVRSRSSPVNFPSPPSLVKSMATSAKSAQTP